jgi:hypothetical protein
MFVSAASCCGERPEGCKVACVLTAVGASIVRRVLERHDKYLSQKYAKRQLLTEIAVLGRLSFKNGVPIVITASVWTPYYRRNQGTRDCMFAVTQTRGTGRISGLFPLSLLNNEAQTLNLLISGGRRVDLLMWFNVCNLYRPSTI